jgi:basic endochitinase B
MFSPQARLQKALNAQISTPFPQSGKPLVAAFLCILSVQTVDAAKENLPYKISEPKCASENIDLKNSQATIRSLVDKRTDIAALGLKDNAQVVETLIRGTALPCVPGIDTSKTPSAWPENVQRIHRLLPEAAFKRLINPDIVATRNINGVSVTGKKPDSQPTYADFLDIAARYPYFCGEQGVWASTDAACQRELATFFAHAAQETGGGQTIHRILEWTREDACWPLTGGVVAQNDAATTCTAYDGLCPSGLCPVDAHYYGRGIKQVSWYFNYMGISGTFLKDPKILIDNPDLVAQDGYLLLASGLWFFMTPQPPKPSMHDVMTGRYTPTGAANGVRVDADGSVTDKFAATVSIVNGGNECSSIGPPPTKDNIDFTQASMNRFARYLDMLDFLGVSASNRAAVEKSYVANTTYCTIAMGNAFADPKLSFSPPILVQMGSCTAISWEDNSLNISAIPNAYAFCKDGGKLSQ